MMRDVGHLATACSAHLAGTHVLRRLQLPKVCIQLKQWIGGVLLAGWLLDGMFLNS